MNLSQEIHRKESHAGLSSLFDKNDYFRLKVIELKERRVSKKLTDIEHEMVVLEDLMKRSSPQSQAIYLSIVETLNKKFDLIDEQILQLENGSLEDEEKLIGEIEFNLESLENKIDVFTHFFES